MSTHSSLPEGGHRGATVPIFFCPVFRVGPVSPFALLLSAGSPPRLSSCHGLWFTGSGGIQLADQCLRGLSRPYGWLAAPGPQIVWAYNVDELQAQLGSLVGLRVMDASQLLSLTFAEAMLTCGAHICMVKDLISAVCLHLHGGVFLDLDNLVVGLRLPLYRGHAFGLEPVKILPPQRHPNRTLQVELVTVRVNLGLLAGPRNSGILADLARSLYHYWRNRISRYSTGQRVAAVAQYRSDVWMANTNALHDLILQHNLVPAVLAAVRVSPWPRWMQRWMPPGTVSYGYTVPTEHALQQNAVVINTWISQWSASNAGDRVRAYAQTLRDANFPGQQPDSTLRRLSLTFQGQAFTEARQGPARKAPVLYSSSLDSGVYRDLLQAASGENGRVGWWQGQLRFSDTDLPLLAALARISFKDKASHLYKQARSEVNTSHCVWGPFPLVMVTANQWGDLQQAVRRSRYYGIWVILEGAMEFSCPGRVATVIGHGHVAITDWLCRGGSLSPVMVDTRVVWMIVPGSCPFRPVPANQLPGFQRFHRRLRLLRQSSRRARGAAGDPRQRRLPTCCNGHLQQILG